MTSLEDLDWLSKAMVYIAIAFFDARNSWNPALTTSTGSFAPVTLEQLAREAGVLRADGTTPCVTPKTAAPSSSTARYIIRSLFARADDSNSQCVVYPLGRMMSTSSFALYTFSAAVFVQALVLISFSPVADYGMSSMSA
jgi:MFS-type transporter involved in bile tolerance (Atg22 family)